MKIKRYVILPDPHARLHDKKAIACAMQAIPIVKPDGVIFLGDIGEWETVNHWRYKRRKRPPLEYQLPEIKKEIADVNEFMDDWDKVFKRNKVYEKHLIQGNHDLWLDNFVEEQVGDDDSFDKFKFHNALRLKERGYKYYRAGKYLKIGPVYFYHGHLYGGPNHTASHLAKMGCNVIYAHHHDYQLKSISHIDDPKMACSMGCLKNMSAESNDWLGGRLVNWTHCFGIIDFFDGLFKLEVCTIIHGRTTLWGHKLGG